jgi:hypothetical protein
MEEEDGGSGDVGEEIGEQGKRGIRKDEEVKEWM